MNDRIQFHSFSEESEAPDYCPLCKTGDVMFAYSIEGSSRKQPDVRCEGFCCLRCGQQLLASLEQVVLATWAEPETAIQSN